MIGQILLTHVVGGIGVGIKIPRAVIQLLRAAVVAVLEMGGDFSRTLRADPLQSAVDGADGGIVFYRCALAGF